MKALGKWYSSSRTSNQKTYILPFEKNHFLNYLKFLTKPYGEKPSRKKDYKRYRFTGKIEGNSFRLTRTVLEPNNFLSIAEGSIEPTSKGCLLQIKYKNFKFTKILIWFWIFLGISLSIYFGIFKSNYFYSFLIGIFTAAHSAVCFLSISRQRKVLKDIFEEVIETHYSENVY